MIRYAIAFCVGSWIVMSAFIMFLLSQSCSASMPIPATTTIEGCRAACLRLAELHCIEGVLNCASWCAEYEEMGLDQHTGCLARIVRCSDAPMCSVER